MTNKKVKDLRSATQRLKQILEGDVAIGDLWTLWSEMLEVSKEKKRKRK